MSNPVVNWRARLRYRFENTLSRGTVAIIAWLALLSMLIVLAAAAAWLLLGVPLDPTNPDSIPNFTEGSWQALMHAMDAGNLAADQGWGLRGLMLLVTIGGIFIVSSLIGTITSGLQNRLDELRKGRSQVIERDHTLILGWNSKIHSIIGELILATANQRKPRVVILAQRDKVEMEDELRAKFPVTGRLRVVCRSGDPLDLDDLQVVDPHAARSIIVLAPDNDHPDIHVIKSVLAITNNPQRKIEPYHIVAELRDAQSLEAAELVGGSEALYVQGDDLIARVTAQTCRQSGLSVVYTELLAFAGSEFYIQAVPALSGCTYRTALSAFARSMVVGLVDRAGTVAINPPMERLIEAGEQLIVISEDDNILLPETPPTPELSHIKLATRRAAQPERTLLLGWNIRASTVIRELDLYVSSGSEVVVLCDHADAPRAVAQLSSQLRQQRIVLRIGNCASRAELDAVNIAGFQHVVVLSDPQRPIQHTDAQTLIALLNVRNIVSTQKLKITLVSEMMDLRNQALAQIAQADDFIVSDRLVSLLLSQLAQNRQLHSVFKILFSADGAEIYMRPIGDYVQTGVAVNFYTMLEAAAQRGETAIGYRLAAQSNDAAAAFGVCVNPLKSQTQVFDPADRLIVLAED